MPTLITFSRFGVAICTVFLCVFQVAFGQASPSAAAKAATKFDEYGRLSGCSQSARLDNLAIALQNEPQSQAYILIYGPEGESWGRGKYQFELIHEYLVNARGISDDRIKFIYGGRNRDLSEPKIELWIAPPSASPPEPSPQETEIKTFKGKFVECEAWDAVDVTSEYDAGTGPPVMDVTLASFADMLQQQDQAVAYVVGYNGPEAVPGAWQRVTNRALEALKKIGVEGNRIKQIYGGAGETTRIQLWVAAKDAPPPVIDAGAEALPGKAVQMDGFDDYLLGSEENQLRVFKHLVGILHGNEKLRAFVIVRPESPITAEEESSSDAVTPVAEEDDANERADLAKLLQKWTAQLADERIQSHRLTVLFAPPVEWAGRGLEIWIVPPGVPLPDPLTEPVAPNDPADSKPVQAATPSKPQRSK